MEQDFNQIINRKNTNSVKYDFAGENNKPEGLLPMWVADMDFPAPRAVSEKLAEISRFGIYGYSEAKEDYFAAVQRWYKRHFNWEAQRSWLTRTPGVVFAAAMAVRALTAEGDGVLIQQPVYYPFARVIRENGRRVVNSPLILRQGKYYMDLADMEQKIKQEGVTLFILCSPHNPVGRVWSREELLAAGRLCSRYGVRIVSDEIHGDFVYPGHRHHVLAALEEELAQIAVICTAPSKTFNLAGLQVSNIFIPNEDMRRQFRQEMKKTGYGGLNLMGLAACQAAYEHGETWLAELKAYLAENLAYLRAFVRDRLPGISLIEPEGTYLVWLDLRELDLTAGQQEDLIEEKAGLWLDSGRMFGEEGAGFERMNIACPRPILRRALEQLEAALRGRAERG